MTETTHPIPEDTAVQRRTWIVQRVFWGIFIGVVAVALGGLFGGGALSDRTAANAALKMTYQRFQRVTKQTQYLFDIPADAPASLRFNAAFQKTYSIGSILPRPLRSEASADGFVLTFARSADAPLTVAISARPLHAGSFDFTVANAGARLPFGVFVYP